MPTIQRARVIPGRGVAAYHQVVDQIPNPAPDRAPYPQGGAANPARAERRLLCDAFEESGPDAPTLCEGWTTADLAAHLIIREGRPDAGPGILLSPLASYTERIRRRTQSRLTFSQLVGRLREGPPRFSVYALPGVDKAANSVEFFVHHEDVRRARPGWAPRALPEQVEELLWSRLKMVRLLMRKVPVEVTMVRDDGGTMTVSKPRRGGPGRVEPGPVRVHGAVGELLLWGLGRGGAAQVRLTGDPEAISLVEARDRRL